MVKLYFSTILNVYKFFLSSASYIYALIREVPRNGVNTIVLISFGFERHYTFYYALQL